MAIGSRGGTFHLNELLEIHRVLLEGYVGGGGGLRRCGPPGSELDWGTGPQSGGCQLHPPARGPRRRTAGLPRHLRHPGRPPRGGAGPSGPRCVVLATNSRRYIAGPTDYLEARVDDWTGFFADSLTTAVDGTHRLWSEIETLLEDLIRRAGNPRSDSVARKIIRGLPNRPVVSAETAADAYSVTPTAARAALNRLEASGVLAPTRIGRRRDREWVSEELFLVLDHFEHDLAQPEADGTRRPAPPPTRRLRG